MSTALLILALFSFICGLALLTGGLIGMLDLESPQPGRTHLFRALDLILSHGLFLFLDGARKNWNTRNYERDIIIAGAICLAASFALTSIAIIFGG